MHAPAKARNNVAQGAVVDVEDTLPHDAVHIEVERIPLKDMVVNQRGKKVVCRRNGVKVAREVEIDVLHRHDLCIAAACRAALHPKTGSE